MDASSDASIFSTKAVPCLNEYLKQTGIQSSGKRTTALVEVCVKGEEIKVPKISEEEEPVDPAISMKEQVKTNNEGYLANPLEKDNQAFGKWSHNFSDVPDFRFPDLFNYIVDKDPGYNAVGYTLHFDGHAEEGNPKTYHFFRT